MSDVLTELNKALTEVNHEISRCNGLISDAMVNHTSSAVEKVVKTIEDTYGLRALLCARARIMDNIIKLAEIHVGKIN